MKARPNTSARPRPKRSGGLPLTAMAILLTAGLAAPPAGALDGEALFQNKCGQCHRSGGEALPVAPVKYAGVQWKRFFDRSKHERKKPIDHVLTPEEMAAVSDYLIGHAADSDRPISAGTK